VQWRCINPHNRSIGSRYGQHDGMKCSCRRRRGDAVVRAGRRAPVGPRRWHSHRCDAGGQTDQGREARL